MSTPWDVVVIGSGAGGLAAAVTTANEGRSTLVLEAAADLGGMLNPFRRKGYNFDVGLHYVGQAGPGQPFRRLLDRMGLDGLRFRENDPDCIDRYVFDGYENRLVKGIDRWIDGLCRDFPREEKAIRGFSRLMQAADAVRRTAMRGRPGARDALAMVQHPIELTRLLRETLKTTLDRWFVDPNLKAVFAGPGGDIGVPPSRASAFISIMVLLHYLSGSYFPEGGGGGLRDALVARAREKGAELRTRAVVERISRSADGWVVRSGGEEIRARMVISNADALATLAMIEGATVDRHTSGVAARARPSLGAVCVFAGVDMDVAAAGMGSGNAWHYGTSDIDGLYAPLYEGRLPERTAFFLAAPTLKDPGGGHAPPGKHVVQVIAFAPPEPFREWWNAPVMRRGAAYQGLKQELADRLLDGAERYIPGLRGAIEVLEVGTPPTAAHYVRARDGGIYGPEHAPDLVGPRRFRTTTGIPGLYLAGASVLGCGVHPCMLSGFAAGRRVIGEG
jgi:phytoene dehydrogenase-like protein